MDEAELHENVSTDVHDISIPEHVKVNGVKMKMRWFYVLLHSLLRLRLPNGLV